MSRSPECSVEGLPLIRQALSKWDLIEWTAWVTWIVLCALIPGVAVLSHGLARLVWGVIGLALWVVLVFGALAVYDEEWERTNNPIEVE